MMQDIATEEFKKKDVMLVKLHDERGYNRDKV
jgi:hypothetical protein